MPPRRELCRNFQRGSCQYGDRCKFIHAADAPQQQKSSTFGFGMPASNQFQRTDQQQQAPNPFGFGVQSQSNAQQRGGNDFGSAPNQFKPFENKWTRSSATNTNNASVGRKQESQPPAASHKCTDPESCKRIMMEDLQNERPLWKLTCYGHKRDGPCDITGDVSCEELRALAYDDAKSGKNLQFIIQRERDLLNSMEAKFQNLIQKPSLSSNSTISNQSPFAGNQSNTLFINNSNPPAVSSFGQLGASLNTTAVATPNFNFGRLSSTQNNAQPAGGMLQTNQSPFNISGTNSSQMAQQKSAFSVASANSSTRQNPFFNSASNSATTAQQNPFAISSNLSSNSAHQNPFSTSANPWQVGNANGGKQVNFHAALLASNPSATTNNMGSKDPKVVVEDDSIWSKPDWKWNCGEIPEEAPPDKYIY